MATREKTVIYSFPMTTADVTDATVTNLTQITINLPETAKTFTSVYAEVGFQDFISATGGTITEHRVGLRLGAAAYTTFTETDDITNSGENIAGVIGPVDFTTHFTTNWTGTSMTCDLQVYFDQNTGTTFGMRNVTAMLYITYTYDDNPAVNATQVKTVRLPLESLIGALTTTVNSQIGTNQIPQLTGTGGILPENSVSIVDYAFIIEGNEHNNNTTTDFSISCSIDSGTATTFGVQEAALASDRFCRWIYKPAAPATTSAHSFHMWSSVANKMFMTAIELVVTYTFNAASTTRVLNSICVPLEFDSPLGYTSAADTSRITRDVIISDPGTITQRQSALRLHWNATAGQTITVDVGNQTARVYAHNNTLLCGGLTLQQRIDSGAATGAALTLARGRNSFVIDVFGNNATIPATNVSGYLILNYESDVSSGGIGGNNHTMYKIFQAWDALQTSPVVYTGKSIAIPETNYWLSSCGFLVYLWANISNMYLGFDCEYGATEGPGAGWEKIYGDAYVSDAELGCSKVYFRARDVFRRFPNDTVGNRMNIEAARSFRYFSSTGTAKGIISIHSTHTNTWTISGNISGNAPALPTELRLIDEFNDEIIEIKTLAGGVTAYSFTVYNDVINYYVDAYQDNTHVGRSAITNGV
jgi:hypothetical protein